MNEKYKVEFSLQADKFLSKIDKPLRKKIIRRIEWLAKIVKLSTTSLFNMNLRTILN